MTRVHHSMLALLGALALAPLAVAAQDITPKRVSITGGYALAEPTRNPQIDGTRTEVDGEGTPTLGVTYHVTDAIGVEAWGAADSFGHRVRTANGKAASVSAQPVALSGQYRFGQTGDTVRPFVGLGVHQTNFNEETATSGGAYAGQRIGIETVTGPMATAGVDVDLAEHWFARADVRYLHGDSDVHLNGAPAGEMKLEPVVLGVGVGVRF